MLSKLTPLGWKLLQEDCDLLVGEYLFRPPWILLISVLVGLFLWRIVRRARGEELDRLASRLTENHRFVAVILALGTALASWWVNVRVLGGLPHTQDEIAYLFQARTLASGRLFLDPLPDGLEQALSTVFLVHDNGRWYGKYPFGWPLVLSFGCLIGCEAIVNPITNALALVLFHGFLCRHGSAGWALTGSFLLACSPFFVLMGASFLSQPLTLLLFLGLLWCHDLAWEEAREWDSRNGQIASRPDRIAVWTGLLTAMLVTVRPFDALVLSVPICLPLVCGWIAQRRFRTVVVLIVASACGVALTLAYNQALTNDPFLTPFLKYSAGDRPGFGPRVGTFDPEGHNLYKGVLNLTFNTLVLNEDLFGWPSIGVVVVLLGLILPATWSRVERVVLACCAGIYLLYFCFMGHGLAFGARYYHVLLPAYVWFTLRAFDELVRRFGERMVLWLRVIVPFLCLIAFSTYYPGRLAWLEDYWDVLSRPRALLSRYGEEPAVVVVPALKVRGFRDLYDSFFSLNVPGSKGSSRIFVRDGPWTRTEVFRRAFPGRRIVTLELDASVRDRLTGGR